VNPRRAAAGQKRLHSARESLIAAAEIEENLEA
jgi:hypothetical protein